MRIRCGMGICEKWANIIEIESWIWNLGASFLVAFKGKKLNMDLNKSEGTMMKSDFSEADSLRE